MEIKQSAARENTTGRLPFFQGLRGTLLKWFLLLALVPMILVGLISYYSARNALMNTAIEKLVAVREINKNVLQTLFTKWQSELLFVSQMEILKNDIADMAAGFDVLGPQRLKLLYSGKPDLMDAYDGSTYSVAHREEHSFFKKYSKIQQYEDVLFIDPAGNVVYTEQKGQHFGVSLTSRSYQGMNLARLYKRLQTASQGEIFVVDAAVFNNEIAMFMGAPVYKEDTCVGYVVFQLPLKYLSRRMGSKIAGAEGSTWEVYLVGSDLRMRTDSFNDPVNRSVQASLMGTVAQNGVDSEGVREALAGKSDVCIITDYRGEKVISAHAPVNLAGLHWVILCEVDKKEAMAPVILLANVTAGLAVIVAFFVLLVSIVISGRIAGPIRSLTLWSRRVIGGDFTMVDIKVPDNEISMLNESFKNVVKSMQASRDEQEDRNWQRVGLSELDDCMRGDQEPESLCRKIVTFIATYLNAQVGAFYLNDGQGRFHLIAGYAYTTRKNLSNEFKMGEGLVGQAALEKHSILLTGVPEDYIFVSAGLVETPPRNIFVIPFVYNDVTVAVMELGTFQPFSQEQRSFLEENAQRIAIALDSAAARRKLQTSFDVTRQQSIQLKEQQEELKAVNEELEEQTQALEKSQRLLKDQQEELQVSNEELMKKNESLKHQKKEVEETKKSLEKKAKDLAIAGKYKSEFLANMSHELRTPLNSLLLLSNILGENKDKNLTPDQLKSIGIIYQSGNDLLSLINEILDLAKIESGKMDLNCEEVSIQRIADNILVHFKHMIDEKGLDLIINIVDGAPECIYTDRKRFEQILKNLMSNAIKFTEKGSIRVEFNSPAKNVDLSLSGLNSDEAVAIAVVDTGIGMSPEDQKIVFEAFQQAEGGTARKYSGTGLGLSISRELARLLGGEIHLTSELGNGTMFTLYLPAKSRGGVPGPYKHVPLIPEHSPVATEGINCPLCLPMKSIPDDRDSIGTDKNTILVVEDDLKFAKLLLQLCHERGLKCLAASTGEEGLELAEKYLPQAIILDIKLPGIDGWTVLERLKENSELRHIPVHIMSGDAPTMEAFRKGAIGYLQKPITKDDLDLAFCKLTDVFSKSVKNLLVVEDDENLRKNIIRLIGNGDVVSVEVATGEAAIQALTSKNFDCMILDLGLPDMTGFELLKSLESNDSLTIPPVIVYTGRELTRQEEASLGGYAESIIIKGVKSEERLLDEASLFLHRLVSRMPEKKRQMIVSLHDSESMFKDKTVLVVDDDMRNVYALSRLLEDKGMRVLKAENGKKALDILKETVMVDLVLMDIMMPVMDGYETMKRIRAQKQFEKMPIIALTAKVMMEDKARCIDAGASDYLPKPVDEERLSSMMRVWLYQ